MRDMANGFKQNIRSFTIEEEHDHEWCRIRHDDRFQFETLCLERASVGLSWKTIMHKRDAYQKAFFNFDIEQCAVLTDAYPNAQMENPSLIRNRNKICTVRKNVAAVKRIQEEFGSFDRHAPFPPNNSEHF